MQLKKIHDALGKPVRMQLWALLLIPLLTYSIGRVGRGNANEKRLYTPIPLEISKQYVLPPQTPPENLDDSLGGDDAPRNSLDEIVAKIAGGANESTMSNMAGHLCKRSEVEYPDAFMGRRVRAISATSHEFPNLRKLKAACYEIAIDRRVVRIFDCEYDNDENPIVRIYAAGGGLLKKMRLDNEGRTLLRSWYLSILNKESHNVQRKALNKFLEFYDDNIFNDNFQKDLLIASNKHKRATEGISTQIYDSAA